MRPEKKVEIVEVVFWTSRNTEHRHRTESTALKCIAKSDAPKHVTNKWTPALYLEVLSKRERDSMTFDAIGKTLGISGSRARAAFQKADRLRRKGELK